MPTKPEVLSALRSTGDYVQAAKLLGIPPGQAHLIATGVPADGSPRLTPHTKDAKGSSAALSISSTPLNTIRCVRITS